MSVTFNKEQKSQGKSENKTIISNGQKLRPQVTE